MGQAVQGDRQSNREPSANAGVGWLFGVNGMINAYRAIDRLGNEEETNAYTRSGLGVFVGRIICYKWF
jgi:hypothetical protein